MGPAGGSARIQEGEQRERKSLPAISSGSSGRDRRRDARRILRLRERRGRTERARESSGEGEDVPYLGCPSAIKSWTAIGFGTGPSGHGDRASSS